VSFGAGDLEAVVPRLRRYARALTGSREAADDLTQDTLERAWRKRSLWRPGTDLRAWMFTLMHNVFVNHHRRARSAVLLDGDQDEAGRLEADAVDAGLIVAEMGRALAALPDDQRAVVLLVGLEELTYAQAAEVLGVPLGTVMSRLARGRERLRTMLEAGTAGAAGDARPAALRRIK
jgi:RNA polymerase sigma-70 factor (ECF subfamily)